jgi:beta-1,2-mannobiose phosphorylase / 1,2-beta-oligomannan phosphorylase
MDIALPLIIIALFAAGFVLTIFERSLERRGKRTRAKTRHLQPKRAAHNPVISPLHYHEWEEQASFNPAAIIDERGDVHLFYRAIGNDGISRIGYAVSSDGRHFASRTKYPVFQTQPGCWTPERSPMNAPHRYDIEAHPSGGGWGGAEDPRATKIGDRVYMTYTAFEGWDDMRIGLTSISLNDLKQKRWAWKRPRLISPARERAKNWIIFPQKINGKYAILHSVAPKILVNYVDSLDIVPKITSSKDHGGYGTRDPNRAKHWDNVMKGAGAPPLKTDRGWLLLYHAIEDNAYKVGAMILDLNDPAKVLYRSPSPILAPNAHYENDGKPGIVYATGAVIKDGDLLIYYGGGDKHVCVAEIPLNDLLAWLVEYGKI